MGQAFRKLFDTFFGNTEMRVVMLGLDAAGKTTILYKLHIGEVLSTVPTIGMSPTVRSLLQQLYFSSCCIDYGVQSTEFIYVVDSLDRERIGNAKQEFQVMDCKCFFNRESIFSIANIWGVHKWFNSLIFCVQKGAMTPMEVCEGLGLNDLKNRKWHIQGTCALKGDGLYEGLDWLSSTLKELKAAEYSSVGTSLF
ncbi:hypothetical protein C3L33_16296, partial [Rhododendron williamsianum]